MNSFVLRWVWESGLESKILTRGRANTVRHKALLEYLPAIYERAFKLKAVANVVRKRQGRLAKDEEAESEDGNFPAAVEGHLIDLQQPHFLSSK